MSSRFGENILVTAGGKSLRNVEEKDILEVNKGGDLIQASKIDRPSKELSLHLGIYHARKDVNSIIHVHPVYTTAFAARGKTIPMVTATSRLKLIKIPLVGYADPGSQELSRLVYEAIEKEEDNIKAVILIEHGLLTFSSDMEDCFNVAELVEETAKIAYISGEMEDRQ